MSQSNRVQPYSAKFFREIRHLSSFVASIIDLWVLFRDRSSLIRWKFVLSTSFHDVTVLVIGVGLVEVSELQNSFIF